MAVIPGEGTTISMDGTVVAQVTAITPPGGSVAEIETTHLQSANKEFRPSKIPEAGEMEFTCEFDPNDTGHQAIAEAVKVPAIKAFIVTYNTGQATPPTDSFNGFITAFEPDEVDFDGSNIMASVTIRITGVVTRTPGAGT